MKARNYSELAHAWASRNAEKAASGECGNMSFNGPTLFSWATPVARIHADAAGKPVALFSAERYSSYTSRQMSHAERAWRGNGDSFHVPSLGAYGGRHREPVWNYYQTTPDHAANLAHFRARYDEAALRFRRCRDDESSRDMAERLAELANDSREYARAFALLTPEFYPEADADEITAFRAARRARLDTPAAAAKRERARLAREAKAERDAEERARRRELDRLADADKLAAWLAGEPVSVPWAVARNSVGSCYLRRKGAEVQTSQGATVPLDHGERLYRFAAKLRAEGREFVANGHKFAVGLFAVSRISASGDITAGCHLIEWAEAERFAKLEGWAK